MSIFSYVRQKFADRPIPGTSLASAYKPKDPRLFDEEAVYALSTWINRFPDLDTVLVKAGLTRASLRVLEYDDEVAQCIDTRREALIATPWRIEPQASRSAKRLNEMLAPHIETLLRGAFNALLYGYSVQEVVYNQGSKGIGIESISEKPLEWFYLSPSGILVYRPLTGIDIQCDPQKYLLTRRQPSYRMPYGEALLSRLYWTVFFRGHGKKFWAKFLERFGEPLLIGKVADQAKFVQDIATLGIAAALPVQEGDSVDAITVTQSGEFERFDSMLSKSIQKMILGQTLTSDVGKSGSFAAAKVHDQVRLDKRNADMRLVSTTVQTLIDNLCALNGWGAPPSFTMADNTGLEQDRATRDALLVEKGVLKLTEAYLLDRYDFRPGDFEIVAAPTAPAVPDVLPVPTDPPAMFSRATASTFTAAQTVIENGISETIGQLNAPMTGEDLKQAILSAHSPADLEDRLGVLLQKADRTHFNEVMSRALFAADVIGYVHAQDGA